MILCEIFLLRNRSLFLDRGNHTTFLTMLITMKMTRVGFMLILAEIESVVRLP